jgi:hypothetical protein
MSRGRSHEPVLAGRSVDREAGRCAALVAESALEAEARISCQRTLAAGAAHTIQSHGLGAASQRLHSKVMN